MAVCPPERLPDIREPHDHGCSSCGEPKCTGVCTEKASLIDLGAVSGLIELLKMVLPGLLLELGVGDCPDSCPPGEQGPQGIQGADGATGADGAQGIQGLQGLQGTQGANGMQGIQGDPGATGGQGIPGLNGTDGINGTNGVDAPTFVSAIYDSVNCQFIWTMSDSSTVPMPFDLALMVPVIPLNINTPQYTLSEGTPCGLNRSEVLVCDDCGPIDPGDTDPPVKISETPGDGAMAQFPNTLSVSMTFNEQTPNYQSCLFVTFDGTTTPVPGAFVEIDNGDTTFTYNFVPQAPLGPGAYNYGIAPCLEDAAGNVTQEAGTCGTFSITTQPVPTVANDDSYTGTVGTAFSQDTSVNDVPSIAIQSIVLLSGSLPPGLALNVNGTLSGTPTTVGTFTYMYTLTSTSASTDTASVTVVVSAAADITPPQKIAVIPADGAEFITISQSPQIAFNEAIDPVSAQANLAVRPVSGADLPIVITEGGSNLWTLNPTADLINGSFYEIVAKAGLSDLAGNQIGAEDICGTFKTAGFLVEESVCTVSTCYIDSIHAPEAQRVDYSLAGQQITTAQMQQPGGILLPNVNGISGLDLTLSLIGGDLNNEGDGDNYLELDLPTSNPPTNSQQLMLTFNQEACVGFSMSAQTNANNFVITADTKSYWSNRPDFPGQESVITNNGTSVVQIADDPVGQVGFRAVGSFQGTTVAFAVSANNNNVNRWFLSIYLLPTCASQHYHDCDGVITRLEDNTTGHIVGEWLEIDCADINVG